MDDTWTISELAEHAAAALTADRSAQVSGRVRDLPNERLIRWYTTIGLVDPPLGRRGRTARYGPRHLLQLVAVKRRQAAGNSIAEIQLELAGATDTTLERIAARPATPGTSTQHPVPEPAQDTGPRMGRETAPAPPAPSTPPPTAADSAPAPVLPDGKREPARGDFWSARPDISYTGAAITDDYGEQREDAATPRPAPVQGVRLAPGLTVLLDVPALSGDDLAAIAAAAGPLLDELHRRGLLTPAASPDFLPAARTRRPQ